MYFEPQTHGCLGDGRQTRQIRGRDNLALHCIDRDTQEIDCKRGLWGNLTLAGKEPFRGHIATLRNAMSQPLGSVDIAGDTMVVERFFLDLHGEVEGYRGGI